MDPVFKAESKIILAADRWARAILDEDRVLTKEEEDLLKAVLDYISVRSEQLSSLIPGPPNIPSISKHPTVRYSSISTVPSPKKRKKPNTTDIDNNDEEEQE